ARIEDHRPALPAPTAVRACAWPERRMTMSSSPLEVNPAPHPGAELEHLGGSLARVALALGLGLTLGGPPARAVRAARLPFTWAALPAGAALLARGSRGGLAPGLAAAGSRAALVGRRWHREDLRTGADAAWLARARATPADAARALARRV